MASRDVGLVECYEMKGNGLFRYACSWIDQWAKVEGLGRVF